MNIYLENISKGYKLNKELIVPALNNINFEFKQGEFSAIVGPSGCGKTTLLNIIGCIDCPTKGTLFFDSKNINQLSEVALTKIRRNKIGYIFQFFNLIPTLTSFENASLPFWDQDRDIRKELTNNLKEVFEKLGIFELRSRFPKQLSGGQQQRVAIARALANKPSIIIADEPTGNLDSKTTEDIITLMRKENKISNTIFLIATHNVSLLKYFDRVIYLKDGMIEKIQKVSDATIN